MAFDLKSAKPVEQPKGGFDLSSARPANAPPPPQQTQPPVQNQGGFVNGVKETVSNIIPSATNVASNLTQAVVHPLDTGMALWDAAAGGLQALLAPESFKKSGNPFLYSPEAANTFHAAADFYKNRYGSVDNAIKTVKTDPVGVAMDLSAVTGILGKAADAAKLSGVAKAANAVSKAVDPVRQVAKVAKSVVKPAYEYGIGLSTGAGAEAIKNALQGGDAFTQAMRGKISESDVLDTARAALQQIKDERGAKYRAALGKIAGSNKQVNIDGIKKATDGWLQKYGIKKSPDGSLDFSRSTLRNNTAAANEVKSVYETIMDWGSKPGDNTPIGLDTLKRVIQDSYTSQNPSRAMTTSLSNLVKSKISEAVPEYSKMTRDYAQTSQMIKDLNKGLGLGDKAATDTALRKLMMAMREDKTFRRSLIETLHKNSGEDVAGAVSGLLLKNPWSNRLGPIAHFYGTSAIAAYLHNPALLGLLPLASPRLMGETSRLLGSEAPRALVPAYQGAYQIGNIQTDGLSPSPLKK